MQHGVAVEMRGIGKSFGAVRALDHVDLTVCAGTLHAIVGENGAGKTTLMRILFGAIAPTDGTYVVADGPDRPFRSSAQAIWAGIGMVSQHYSIIPDLTCLENLMLGAEPGWLIRRREAEAEAESLAQRMGFQFAWDEPASTLSPAAAQKLEILKLLWRKSRVMILDEPTAMLSPSDGDALFASLKKLVADGATVILVTHRLPEVMEHCSHVTVLRGGQRVADLPVRETNASQLAELIVGHAVPESAPHAAPDRADPLLTVHHLTVLGDRGEEAVRSASFMVRKGEVLGIAGVDGSGQRELFETLIGTRSRLTGEAMLGAQSLFDQTVAERINMGLRVIPEDRHEEAVIESWSLESNGALGLQRLMPFGRGAWIQTEGRRQSVQEMAERLDTQFDHLGTPISSLSGGNQQRFVAGRALYLTPRLVLAFQPARGLDIEATRRLYEAFYEECQRGAGVLVVSFDLDELLKYTDRVIVMNGGRLSQPHFMDRGEIGRLMVGVTA